MTNTIIFIDFFCEIFPLVKMDAFNLKKYDIKPCVVKLDRCTFTKIKIGSSATSSEKNEELYGLLKQIDSKTFSISVKRTFHHDGNEPPSKKVKCM